MLTTFVKEFTSNKATSQQRKFEALFNIIIYAFLTKLCFKIVSCNEIKYKEISLA
jgi:hypothetical protein